MQIENDGKVTLYRKDGTEFRRYPVDVADFIQAGIASLTKPKTAAPKPAAKNETKAPASSSASKRTTDR